MKKWPIIFIAVIAIPVRAVAMSPVKLPYAKGQSFVVTQGYNTPPTHIKKDSYALDLTQNGCDAYGKSVVAAAAGTAMFVGQEGYNGGYGTELIINHGGNIVSRYAHMIPGSITVSNNGFVRQGDLIGLVGDTGLVAGLACADHPGTHLHFAMDFVAADGTFVAYDPEPISGYTNMTVGKWYLSDNGEEDVNTAVSAATTSQGYVLGAYDVATSTTTVTATATTTATNNVASTVSSAAIGTSPSPSLPMGGVSVVVGTNAAAGPTSIPPPALPDNASSTDIATGTILVTPSGPPASGTLFEQTDDSAQSDASWYDDNWFELGNGFSGTLNTLTLEGRVSDVTYSVSSVTLEEFKDKNYTAMVAEFPISDNAPFTNVMATTTFTGLSIPLKPYFYYRLATIQNYQNRSVILAGTTTTTTGVAMHDSFIPGFGRVESTSTFFPFMVMEGTFATSTLSPSPLTAPANLAETFDGLGMQLNISYSTSTDPDWPANPLGYEMNYSTSTTLSDAGWSSLGSIPVVIGNTYLMGIRAVDGFGDVSAPATTTWNFPAGFAPYLLSPSLGYAYQYFTVPATSTLQSIQLFTTNVQTTARFTSSVGCFLQLFDEYDLSSLGVTPSDNGFSGSDCAGSPVFSFASSSVLLHPDHTYHWVFTAQTGNPSTSAGVQFYGTANDTAGGKFSDPSLANAKFTVTGDTGVLFSN